MIEFLDDDGRPLVLKRWRECTPQEKCLARAHVMYRWGRLYMEERAMLNRTYIFGQRGNQFHVAYTDSVVLDPRDPHIYWRVATVEDWGGHYRVRGTNRYDNWRTIDKSSECMGT